MKFLSKVLLPFTFLFLGISPLKADDYSLTTDPNSDCTNTDYLKETGEYLGTDRLVPSRGENLGECVGSVRNRQGELLDHVNSNASNISTNTSNITTNTSNISTNTSAIETLQGSSSTSDISANTNNINNLGEGVAGSTALTAALSALPQTSKESKLSCGVGTGAYSSRYAVGFGCASKVNERVDINAGGSYVFGGSKSYGGGTLDSGVVKAGFVFKLGELNKPTQISLNESKELKKEVNDLKAKNDEIISQNQKLLARLENLENIALKFQGENDVISMSK